jgi:hypothetical protein
MVFFPLSSRFGVGSDAVSPALLSRQSLCAGAARRKWTALACRVVVRRCWRAWAGFSVWHPAQQDQKQRREAGFRGSDEGSVRERKSRPESVWLRRARHLLGVGQARRSKRSGKRGVRLEACPECVEAAIGRQERQMSASLVLGEFGGACFLVLFRLERAISSLYFLLL